MGRTPENENIIRNENQQLDQNAETSYADTQKLLSQYQSNIGTLERGGSVGANPWETPAYLANQNKETAYSTSGADSAGKEAILAANRRAGGLNTGGSLATIKDLALGKMRTSNQLQAQQRAQDFGKNIQFQQYLAGAPLSAASTEEGLYGPSVSGTASTAGDLSQYALAQQKEWYQNINQAIQAGTAVAGAGAGAAGGGGVADEDQTA